MDIKFGESANGLKRLGAISNWKIPGTGDSASASLSRSIPGISFGWRKIIEASVGIQAGTNWINIENEAFPSAKYAVLPNGSTPPEEWERFYLLEMKSAGPNLGVGIGPSIDGYAIGGGSSGAADWSDGSHVYRRNTSLDAEQEKGDPTGFLGAALQDGMSGQIALGSGPAISRYALAMGCTISGNNGLLVATAVQLAKILGKSAGLEHLLFKYGAVYRGGGTAYGVGAGISVSFEVAQIEHLHCFVRTAASKPKPNPTDVPAGIELYCYTRSLKDGKAGKPYFSEQMTSRFPSYSSAELADYLRAIQLDQQIKSHIATWNRDYRPNVGFLGDRNTLALQNLAARRSKAGELAAILERRSASSIFGPLRTNWLLPVYGVTHPKLVDEMKVGK